MTEHQLFCLFEPLNGSEGFCALKNAVSGACVAYAYGVEEAQRTHVLAALMEATGRTLVVVVPNDIVGQRIVEDMNALLPGAAALLPAREVSFVRSAASSRDLTIRRLETIGRLVTGQLRALVLPADAWMHRLMPRAQFEKHIIHVSQTDRLDPRDLTARLAAAGYENVHMVEAHGQFAVRGGIVDVFPVGATTAVRLEFFDDEIDSLREFDVLTQRSVGKREEVTFFPASETLLSEEEACAAADRLAKLLVSEKGAPPMVNRQREIEKEFDLPPFEDIFALSDEESDDLPDALALPAKGKKGKTGEKAAPPKAAPPAPVPAKNGYMSVVDALRHGRHTDALASLMEILYEHTETIVEYVDHPILALDQPARLRERCENRALEFSEHFKVALERGEAFGEQAKLLLSYDELIAGLDGQSIVLLDGFLRTVNDFRPTQLIKFESLPAMGYAGNVKLLAQRVNELRAQNYRIALLAGGVARGERLEHALAGFDCPAKFYEEPPQRLTAGEAAILSIALSKGFQYPDIQLYVAAETDIFGANKQRARTRAHSGEKIAAFTELSVGDYVVHEDHGIGQYMGTVRLASEGVYRDFLHIRYQGADKLYVPVDQLDRVQKYIGSEGEAPKINRLSGGDWQRQKARAKASVRELAGELVKLYAERASVKGYAFEPDTPWQREFEESFPYEETPDQLAAIEEIKRDMESDKVMDRLLCGDVGYGKTEVALRAIFKAVMSGKQAALLAPTTILVQQHYATMMNRFHGFPVHVDTISRFRTPGEQKQVLEDLKEGKIDVIIGTHRLLGKDVKYKDLGLLVVDEEQRFGVAHKEAIKKLKKSVDVLTLSATPIPRTLHMSMVGIRDMSLLQSPPEERYPVQTYVVEYSDGLVRDAILRELSRGGQVYFLYNRVQTIEAMYNRLKKLVPEARIAVGHGQMREHALEDVMLDFYEGKFDVLLCTTIIEAGLDVPRANTLIVCDADRFGLSQLYQLRGRVGRSNRLAYAYLTVNPNKVMTENADKRLSAIREFTEFGSGFRVAMRDLEIRGMGNLLGAEQSGHMAAIGYDLYVKMNEETVRELRGDASQGDIETRMEIRVDAYVPHEYISNELLRVEMYKKIAGITSREAREDILEELIDRFGDPGRPVMNLIDIAQLKSHCSQLGIDLVTVKGNDLVMRFAQNVKIDVMKLVDAISKHEDCLRLQAGTVTSLIYTKKNASAEELLQSAVGVMEQVAKEAV